MKMWTLGELREFPRMVLDLDETDVPNQLVDTWILEGVGWVLDHGGGQWPFLQAQWELLSAAGVRDYFTADDVFNEDGYILDVPEVLVHDDDQGPIRPIDWEDGEREFRPNHTSSRVMAWSWKNGLIRLHPTPSTDLELIVRGSRQLEDWYQSGSNPDVVPDLPQELRNAVSKWALSKAYQHQEDAAFGTMFQNEFFAELDRLLKRKHRTPPAGPMILNGGSPRRSVLGRGYFPWD